MLKNTTERYGFPARALHWLMAVLIVLLFLVGLTMGLPEKGSWLRDTMKDGHVNIGVLTFVLLLVRAIWRQVNPIPVAGLTPLNAKLAHWGHVLLYILMGLLMLAGIGIVITRSGPTALWWGFSLPGFGGSLHRTLEEVHEVLAWSLITVSAGHVVMAVVHKLQGDLSQRGMLRRGGNS
ncbi:cytochrome b [Gallaecimonas sp. GXIMD1310]|uniref:cytochrome b n=1 Tax=Gallaecimonas sp. GXIMD1310 TaxID=3131926 RepID=UPI0032564BE7